MGKSSAPLKRKRSKNSSKAKASSRRKSGKHKPKKVRRQEVSLSGSDYDDSKSLDTLASSSSEDSYRRKRDWSRTRKDVKGRKKKARRRSYSRDSSEDSVYTRKRKKAKRKNDYEIREKPYKKKKIRREASVSSISSGSWSCSTCQGGSASTDDDNQYESRRGRSERKKKDKRRLERGRSGSEKSSRYRARSCLSCSPSGNSSDEGRRSLGENNSRWLRSVITVTKEVEESGELCRNEIKEEIVEDDEYPCRSNDSNDGGTKRELDHHTLPASEEKLRVEDEIGDKNSDVNFTEPKIIDRSYSDRSNLKAYSAGKSESMKKETNETAGANLDGDDLESILRQRALENLRKFRGEIQSTAKASDQENKIVIQEKQSITELVQGKSIVNNADVGTKLNRQTPAEETSLPVGGRNLIAYPRNNERILNMDEDISGSAKHHLACAPEKVIDADNASETVTESTNYRTNNPELTTPISCQDSLQSRPSLKQTPVSGLPKQKLVVAESIKDRGTFEAAHVVSHSSNDNLNNIGGLSSVVTKPSIHGPKFRHKNLNKGQDEVKEHSQYELKQTSASHEPPNAKFLVTEGDVETNAAKTTQAVIQSISDSGRDVDESHNSATPKSCIESSSGEKNSGKLQNESNQGSQFEQKTMNVMRGGEMVQVSYKVYIPKKAPALARRHLKR